MAEIFLFVARIHRLSQSLRCRDLKDSMANRFLSAYTVLLISLFLLEYLMAPSTLSCPCNGFQWA